MKNPKFLNLYDPEENEAFEIDMNTVDRIIIAPARKLLNPQHREAANLDAMDMVLRVQLKGDSSKEFSLRHYEMEFIYP